MKKQEQFKELSDYPGYLISNYGYVIESPKCRRITSPKNNWGYKYVRIKSISGMRTIPVHRLVALAFIPNPDNKPQVNHINRNKNVNYFENLEWVTIAENINHWKKAELKKKNWYKEVGSARAKEKYLQKKISNPDFHNSKRGRKPIDKSQQDIDISQ